jgi:hypothetical protein
MNTYNHILSEKEKNIIENHFILNGFNSKKDFEKFTIDIVNKYSSNHFDLKHKWRKPAKKDIDYSINLIWDSETDTTILMYLFSHPKFVLSSAKWRQLKTFNGDVNLQNKNGQTALMFLSKTLHLNTLNSDADDFIVDLINNPLQFDLSKRDKDNKTFHIYFFERYAEQLPDKESLSKVIYSFIRKINNLDKVLLHWINTAKTDDKKQNLFVAKTALSVAEVVKSIVFKKNSDLVKAWLHDINKVEKMGQSLELEATMNVNLSPPKRNKI